MKTVLETIQDGAAYLEKRGVEQGRLNMEHLLAHVLGCRRMQLYLWFDRPLGESELAPLRDLTLRRGKREPLQHLLGTVEFCGHEFKCDRRALIPRHETEELIEKIRHRLKNRPVPDRILDMGTGSGVIGLTLAAAWPEAHVVLADASDDALELARENAVKLGLVESRLTFRSTDLFSSLAGEKFDLIVANLPYIPEPESASLSPEVLQDPPQALFGGADGTEIMARFIAAAPAHLNPCGLLAMEIGQGQTPKLLEELNAAGFPNAVGMNDYSGRDRFLFAEFSG